MSEGTALADACLAVSFIEPERPIPGNSELARLTRALDWDSTSIGAPETWPKSLRTAVGIMLTSRQPIWIGWGHELIYLYNDPYKSIIGGKHPWALANPLPWFGGKFGKKSDRCFRRRWAATRAPTSKHNS